MRGRKLTIILSLIIILTVLLIALINYYSEYYDTNQSIACSEEGKVCPDGSIVTRNPDNNCEFDECPSVDGSDGPPQTFCTPESRNTDGCSVATIYQPACGWYDLEKVNCVRYPCARTYNNGCFACADENVLYWTEGECPEG